MLILSRKRGERIQVGEDVILAVLGISGNRVRLGLDAPADRSIMRAELIEDSETQAEPTESLNLSRTTKHFSESKKEA